MFASDLFGLVSFQHQTATVTVNATQLHIHPYCHVIQYLMLLVVSTTKLASRAATLVFQLLRSGN
jgi:hypothetical protein